MGNGAMDMAREFAVLHISHWRSAKAKGLPRSAAYSRSMALWWIDRAKGRQ